jgi:hypothetical protein
MRRLETRIHFFGAQVIEVYMKGPALISGGWKVDILQAGKLRTGT